MSRQRAGSEYRFRCVKQKRDCNCWDCKAEDKRIAAWNQGAEVQRRRVGLDQRIWVFEGYR